VHNGEFIEPKSNQVRKVCVNTPVARLIRIGQGVARNCTAKAHMIKLGWSQSKAGLDISQAFAVGKLSKSHCKELIPTGEALDLLIAVVSRDAFSKLVGWNKVHQLSKNRFPGIHPLSPLEISGEYGFLPNPDSNRKML
jgi:hypothetical protein